MIENLLHRLARGQARQRIRGDRGPRHAQARHQSATLHQDKVFVRCQSDEKLRYARGQVIKVNLFHDLQISAHAPKVTGAAPTP